MPYKDYNSPEAKVSRLRASRKYNETHREENLVKGAVYRKNNPEKVKASQARYNAAHPEHANWDSMHKWRDENEERFADHRRKKNKEDRENETPEEKKNRNAYIREWHIKNPDKKRQYWLKKEYGLTPEDVDRMFKEQKGKCYICSKLLDSSHRGVKPQVDHDHETGKARDLLCMNCNTILGLTKDSVEHLEKCVSYLHRHKPN